MENNFNFQIISVDRLGELSEWEVESGRMVMMGGLGKCCGGYYSTIVLYYCTDYYLGIVQYIKSKNITIGS